MIRAGRAKGGDGGWANNKGSWILYTLPYIEQDNLFRRITSVPGFFDPDKNGMDMVTAANNASPKPNPPILPATFSIARCPSDGWSANDPRFTNYLGSMGPQCNSGSTEPGCNGASFDANCNRPDWGYGPSADHGNTSNASDVRGLFSRGGAVITMSSITDGLSNTLMVGETLPEVYEAQRFFGGTCAWADAYGGSSYGTTTPPMNWRISKTVNPDSSKNSCTEGCPGVDPMNCMWNWGVTWGFKSNHTGGANFANADGSVRFIRDTIDARAYNLLGCRNDGQPTPSP